MRRCRQERAVKPSAQPTLVRTQHLPPPAKRPARGGNAARRAVSFLSRHVSGHVTVGRCGAVVAYIWCTANGQKERCAKPSAFAIRPAVPPEEAASVGQNSLSSASWPPRAGRNPGSRCADLCPCFTGRDRGMVMASLVEVGKSLVEMGKMRAAAGDEVLVKGRRVGDRGREGVTAGCMAPMAQRPPWHGGRAQTTKQKEGSAGAG